MSDVQQTSATWELRIDASLIGYNGWINCIVQYAAQKERVEFSEPTT